LEGSKTDKEKEVLTGEKKASVLNYNYCYGNKKELIEQFNDVKMLNQKVTRTVAHIIISFAPGDKVSDNQMVEISSKLALKMGFDKHQYLAVKHNDTPTHNHLHIVLNRISFEGKTLSDSNNYKKIAEFCREMELEYKLQQVLSPSRFLSKHENKIPRSDARIEDCKKLVGEALLKSKDWDEFKYKLLSKGIMVEKGRGVTFIDEKKVRIKGSKIGFSFDKIDKHFSIKEPELKKSNSISL
jgi:hypothetical protein